MILTQRLYELHLNLIFWDLDFFSKDTAISETGLMRTKFGVPVKDGTDELLRRISVNVRS